MTVDWSLCHWPACIEECRDGPKIDCPAVLAWREKKDDPMTDISKEAAKHEAQMLRQYSSQNIRYSGAIMIEAQAARIAELEAAFLDITYMLEGGVYAAYIESVDLAARHPFLADLHARTKDTSHDG